MDNTVTEALSPDTFDVLSFVEQTAYPEKMVTIFRDIDAAKEFQNTWQARTVADDAKDTAEAERLTARLEELTETLKAGSLTFTLRGYSPGVVNDIQGKYEETDQEGADNELIARAIVAVHNAAGAADTRTWEGDDVKRLKRNIAEGEFSKLLVGVADVLFNAAVFDQAADAGFLS
jgi:hypothetical protein